MARKTLTEKEIAVLSITRDLSDTAIRRGLADVGLRVRLHESAERIKTMLVDFETENA